MPLLGLIEAMRGWSGGGRLYAALAAVEDDVAERQWSGRDVERRARRILLQRLLPHLVRWPTTEDGWLLALPAETRRDRVRAPYPTASTSWSETRRLGWPPSEFVQRPRARIADTLLVTSLRWALDQLDKIVVDARAIHPDVDGEARLQVDAALGLLDVEPVAGAEGISPSHADVRAIALEGKPWVALAPVLDVLRAVDEATALELAAMLLAPEGQVRWRLFHLGVLGELLHALRARGAQVVSRRPLSGASRSGPSYVAYGSDGQQWDLWFEAAGVWQHYGEPSPYRRAAEGVPGAGTVPVGADLLLLRPGDRALVVECKHSAEPARVARDGYHQACTYALEARRLAPDVRALVVGPEDVVLEAHYADTLAGPIGVGPPAAIADALQKLGV